LESSVTRISQIMTSMTASHEQNTTSVSTLSAELVQLDERETELRDIVTRTEEKRSWFADFREWLESVAAFLDEKVVLAFSSNSHDLMFRPSSLELSNLKMNTFSS
jgi:GC-rich sequence DNA-binding factor